jgi:hypothetical protein
VARPDIVTANSQPIMDWIQVATNITLLDHIPSVFDVNPEGLSVNGDDHLLLQSLHTFYRLVLKTRHLP